jgi:hypothetical protein
MRSFKTSVVSMLGILCLLVGTTGRLFAEKPASDKLAARWGSSLKALDAGAYTTQAIRQHAGTTAWKEYQDNPVVKLGAKGQWDSGALGSMTVIQVGKVFHMYYEAWGDKGAGRLDYHSLQIGHAVSPDGLHWAKDPANPVLSPERGGQWDKDGVWDPFVIYEDGKFKMWYGGGDTDHCDWAFAVSTDGSDFDKKARISHLGNVEDDHVVHDVAKFRYYMYYWDRRRAPMGLMRAESANETDFDFAHAATIKIEGETYPGKYKFSHVFLEGGVWYMFYGNFVWPRCPDATIRVATSSDGLHWKCRNKNLLKGHDGEVLKLADRLYVLYYGPQGYFDWRGCDIRAAIYAGDLKDLLKDKT